MHWIIVLYSLSTHQPTTSLDDFLFSSFTECEAARKEADKLAIQLYRLDHRDPYPAYSQCETERGVMEGHT